MDPNDRLTALAKTANELVDLVPSSVRPPLTVVSKKLFNTSMTTRTGLLTTSIVAVLCIFLQSATRLSLE